MEYPRCRECNATMWPSKLVNDGWYCPYHGGIIIKPESNHEEACKEIWGRRSTEGSDANIAKDVDRMQLAEVHWAGRPAGMQDVDG